MPEATGGISHKRWQAGVDLEREEWATLTWQNALIPERRFSEWERHLASIGLSLSSFKSQHVLDVGCGPTGVVYFIDADRRVGVDPLADQYEQWNGHWGAPVELVKSEAESMPFEDASFDSACCINCVDHTRDPSQVVREIGRILKPGGTLVLHVDLDSPLRKLHKRVRPHAGIMHPHSLTYDWLHRNLAPLFSVDAEERDPEVFKRTRQQMRYEAYWDGLLYRLTRSKTWMNHVWLRATRR